MGWKNKVLLLTISFGKKLVKKVIKVMKNRTLQGRLLFTFQVAYILTALVGVRFLWGLRLKMNKHLHYDNFSNVFALATLLVTIFTCLAQAIAHIKNKGPMIPNESCYRVMLVLMHLVQSLVVQGAAGATSGFLAFLANFAPSYKDDYTEQLSKLRQWVSVASAIHAAIVYLTKTIAEPATQEDLENTGEQDLSPSQMIPAWTLLPRLFHCAFAFAGSITAMMSHTDYVDFYAFRFMVTANFCSAIWSCLPNLAIAYSQLLSFAFPNWVHAAIWIIDLVMSCIHSRGLFGAGVLVYVIYVEVPICDKVDCKTFTKAVVFTLVSFIANLVLSVSNTVKRVSGT